MAEVKVFESDCDHCIPQSVNQAHIWYIFAEGNKHYLLRAENSNYHKVIRITKVSKKSLAIHIEGGGHHKSVDTTAITWIDSKYQHICKEAMLSDQYVQYFNTRMTLLQKPLITAYCFIEDNLTLIDSHSCIFPIHTISTSISSTTSIPDITDSVPYSNHMSEKNIEKDTLLLSLSHQFTKNKCISFEFKLKCGFVSHLPISQIHVDSYHSNYLNQNISNNDINIHDIHECIQDAVIDEHDYGIKIAVSYTNETLSKLLSDNKNDHIQTRHTTNDMNHVSTQNTTKIPIHNDNIQYRYHRYAIHQLSKYYTLTYQHHDVRWGHMSHMSIYNPCDMFRCIFNSMKSNCIGYNDENKEHQDRNGSMNKCHAYDIRNTDEQSIQLNSKTRLTSVMYPYKYDLNEAFAQFKECLYTLMNNPQNNMKISYNSNHIHGWDKYDMNSVSTCVTDFFHRITTCELNSHPISMYRKIDLVASSNHSQSKTMQLLPNIIATSRLYQDDGHITKEPSSGSSSHNNKVSDQYNNNDGSDKTSKTIPHSYTSIPTQHTSSPPSLLPNAISILSYLLHTVESDVLDSILMLQALDMLDAEGLSVLYNHILALMGTSNISNMDESSFNIDHLTHIQSVHTSSTSISQESHVGESHTTYIPTRHPLTTSTSNTTTTTTTTTTDEIEALLFAYIQSHPSIDTSLKPLLRVMAMYKLYLSDITSSSLSDLLCNEDNLNVYNGLTKQDNPITSSGNSHSHIHIHTVQMSYNDKDERNHILTWKEFYYLYSQDICTSSNNDNMLDYDENPIINHQANILYQMMSFSIHRYMTSTEIHESHIAYIQYLQSLPLQDCLFLLHGWLISLNAKDISLIITLQNIDHNNIITNITDSKDVYKTTTNTTTTTTATNKSNESSTVDSISIIYKQNDTSPGLLQYTTQSILSSTTTNTTATTTTTDKSNESSTVDSISIIYKQNDASPGLLQYTTTQSILSSPTTNTTNTTTTNTTTTNTATNTTTNTATNTTNTATNTTNTATNTTNTATNTTNTATNSIQIHDDNITVGISNDTIDNDTDTSTYYLQEAYTDESHTHTHSQNTMIPIKNTHYILYQLKVIDIDGKPVNKVTQKLVDDSRVYEEAAYMEQQLLLMLKK